MKKRYIGVLVATGLSLGGLYVTNKLPKEEVVASEAKSTVASIVEKVDGKNQSSTPTEKNVVNELIQRRINPTDNQPVVDKEELTTRMLNSIDYFDIAMGQIAHRSVKNGTNSLTDFAVVKGSGEASDPNRLTYESTKYAQESKNNQQAGETSFEQTLIDTTLKTKSIDGNNNVTPQVLIIDPDQADSTNLNSVSGKEDTLEERISLDQFNNPVYDKKIDNNYLRESKIILLPEDYVLGLLADFNSWSIEGKESYLEFETLVIRGTLPQGYADKYSAESFKMNVDPFTGVLLSFEAYNESNDVQESYQAISFDYPAEISRKVFDRLN